VPRTYYGRDVSRRAMSPATVRRRTLPTRLIPRPQPQQVCYPLCPCEVGTAFGVPGPGVAVVVESVIAGAVVVAACWACLAQATSYCDLGL